MMTPSIARAQRAADQAPTPASTQASTQAPTPTTSPKTRAARPEAGAAAAFSASPQAAASTGSAGSAGAAGASRPLPPPILRAVKAKAWPQALAALDAAKPTIKDAPEQVFLHGLVAHRAGQHERALELLKPAVTGGQPSLRQLAALHAMRAAMELKRYKDALAMVEHLPAHSSAWPEASALAARAHEALAREGDAAAKQRAIRALQAHLKAQPKRAESAWVALALSRLQQEQGQLEDAARSAEHVLLMMSLSPEAAQAQQRLDALLPKLPAKARQAFDSRQPARQVAALEASFGRHRSEQVIEQGVALLKTKPFAKGLPHTCETIYLIGRSYTKLRKHADSAIWYERALKECERDQEMTLKALYMVGKAHWNSDKKAQALTRFEQLWTRFGSSSYADDAMFYSARILMEQGKDKEAQALLLTQVQRWPKGDMASDAHWMVMRAHLERKDYQAALEHAQRVEDPQEQDLYSRGRLAYFGARSRELLGQRDQARAAYEAVVAAHPMGYYALLAMQGLGRLSEGAQAPEDLCALDQGALCARLMEQASAKAQATLIKEEAWPETFARGATLLRLGLDDLAQRELSSLRSSAKGDPDTLWTLAWMLDRAGAYPLSHDIPRRSIAGWPGAYPDRASRRLWEIAYPQPFYDAVESWAQTRGLPQAIIYAIMREESGFNPGIESWANARGLMQLMTKTAEGVAAKEKLKGFEASKLFDAAINIQLGTAYVRELADQLHEHPALIIAGYNGGYANVKRWLDERGHWPLDLWVEAIPYGQTRDYTKRVLTSFWTYSWLYGERLTPRLPEQLRPKP